MIKILNINTHTLNETLKKRNLIAIISSIEYENKAIYLCEEYNLGMKIGDPKRCFVCILAQKGIFSMLIYKKDKRKKVK